MGGATIRAGNIIPHLAKIWGQGSKYIDYILYACNKKYTIVTQTTVM